MAVFERTSDTGTVTISYEEVGTGPPLLLIAPGGMRSTVGAWSAAPWNPIEILASQFRVIAMDQRNAGGSSAPITASDNWSTMTEDQLGLLDHLGVDRFHVAGMCIGGSYIGQLMVAVPERIMSTVVFQTIGLDGNQDAFFEMFNDWANELKPSRSEVDANAWDSFRQNLYGGDKPLFSIDEAQLATCATPTLLLMGTDLFHPEASSRLWAETAPNARLIEDWKQGPAVENAKAEVIAHLQANSD